MQVQRVEMCDSTQDLAWQAEPSAAPYGLVIVAARQQQGRGRGDGRSWTSPEGGLYLSWRLPPCDPDGITLLGGLAVARTVHKLGANPWMKWPNDLWVGQGKIAGVLADCRWRGSVCQGVVLGIGLNCHIELDQLPEHSASLHLCGARPYAVEETLIRLLGELRDLLDVHRDRGLAGYLEEVRGYSLGRGSKVQIWQGDQAWLDQVEGLDAQGHLCLSSGKTLHSADRLVVHELVRSG